MTDDAVLARKAWRTLEAYHGMIYFTPHAAQAYADLGIHGQMGYFASRAAALGPVPAAVVVATFYNFNPELVHDAIPAAWKLASPEAILAARLRAVDESLREVLGDELASDDMVEAAGLARRAADGCTPEGRPLYAAHASLPWPDEPHLVLWHAVTLLREHRGDGHLAALLLADLDGCESLITHGSAGDSAVPPALLQATRGWSDEAWAAAGARLAARGLLDGDRLTEAGEAVRTGVEQLTDEAAARPWARLGAHDTERLRSLVRPYSKALLASGIFGF